MPIGGIISEEPVPNLAEMIGLPWQLVIGPRGLDKGVVELKRRRGGAREELSLEAALVRLTG